MKTVNSHYRRLAEKHLRKAREHERLARAYARGRTPWRRRLFFLCLILIAAAYVYFRYFKQS